MTRFPTLRRGTLFPRRSGPGITLRGLLPWVIGLLGAAAACADSDAPPSGFHATGNYVLLGHCTKCHNSEDWAGGIAFDTLSTTDVSANAETWEKVVRKLRGRLMPPPNAAQPEQHTIDSFVAFMETSLDHAPPADPGNVSLHRLKPYRVRAGDQAHPRAGHRSGHGAPQ